MGAVASALLPVQENANRLKAYKSKLVVFPRRSKKPKSGDASAEELSTAQQQNSRRVLPIVQEKPEAELVDIPSELTVSLPWQNTDWASVRNLTITTVTVTEACT